MHSQTQGYRSFLICSNECTVCVRPMLEDGEGFRNGSVWELEERNVNDRTMPSEPVTQSSQYLSSFLAIYIKS